VAGKLGYTLVTSPIAMFERSFDEQISMIDALGERCTVATVYCDALARGVLRQPIRGLRYAVEGLRDAQEQASDQRRD
jgi:hypothetical protein